MKRFFVHLSEKERRVATDAVEVARRAFGRGGLSLRDGPKLPGFIAEVLLEPHQGVDQFATVHWGDDVFSLRFRAEEGRSPYRVSFLEPRPRADAVATPPDTAAILPVLDEWADALGAVGGEADIQLVERARRTMTEIALAVADAYAPTWSHAAVSAAGSGIPALIYLHIHRGVGSPHHRFMEGEPTPIHGGMTEELGRLLQDAADPFVHVTAYGAGRPKRLQVTIGRAPEVLLENVRDPVGTMRRLAAVPGGARLLPAEGSQRASS